MTRVVVAAGDGPPTTYVGDTKGPPAPLPRLVRPVSETHKAPPVKPPVRALGLTPRLFSALNQSTDAVIRSKPATYVDAIGKHVQSVAREPGEDAKRHETVLARNYVPAIMEDRDGRREVFHVDPVRVRQFRRVVADELKQAHDKRQRMVRRITAIRQSNPELGARDLIARIKRDIAHAEEQVDEPLLHPLPKGTHTLHVLIDVSPHMVQLDLVRQRLMSELRDAISVAGVKRVIFGALSADAAKLPLSLEKCNSCAEALDVADGWLRGRVEASRNHTGAG